MKVEAGHRSVSEGTRQVGTNDLTDEEGEPAANPYIRPMANLGGEPTLQLALIGCGVRENEYPLFRRSGCTAVNNALRFS